MRFPPFFWQCFNPSIRPGFIHTVWPAGAPSVAGLLLYCGCRAYFLEANGSKAGGAVFSGSCSGGYWWPPGAGEIPGLDLPEAGALTAGLGAEAPRGRRGPFFESGRGNAVLWNIAAADARRLCLAQLPPGITRAGLPRLSLLAARRAPYRVIRDLQGSRLPYCASRYRWEPPA